MLPHDDSQAKNFTHFLCWGGRGSLYHTGNIAEYFLYSSCRHQRLLIDSNTEFLDYDSNALKAHSHEHEIVNETSNDDRWRDVGHHCCSKHQDQTLRDLNDNVRNASGSHWTTIKTNSSHWTTIKTNSSHWFPTNSPYYYIIIINYIYY